MQLAYDSEELQFVYMDEGAATLMSLPGPVTIERRRGAWFIIAQDGTEYLLRLARFIDGMY